ncbi:uncharacterized protein FOMMEDRAFT_16246 [Fomitiporia mediterranea MF3/22]|uniref:uncharacterized protein n=1 Tax=Fomitiporia mediterranea (strain MF3/22) TaxID=694068 RepID=UPI00044099F9|nr:uncharacterized protein FOMMEDRAFT_16246 [Fomitiporia mediterranea MF3/22]EJD07599.1 hypothetical protein FOMMEDRAFT_16246 [Fomitiporia mediterranea MF3/22]
MLYLLSFLAFLSLVILLSVYYRHVLIPHLPTRIRTLFPSLSHYQPLSTFADQVRSGMSSSAFDIEANIHDGDSRTGLDERDVQEVHDIMRRERVNFDQARLIRHNRILAENGIDSTGMPTDAKAITRL